jgi:hypothetical protein
VLLSSGVGFKRRQGSHSIIDRLRKNLDFDTPVRGASLACVVRGQRAELAEPGRRSARIPDVSVK